MNKIFFTYNTDVQENLQLQKQSSTERLTIVEYKSSKANDPQVHNTPVNTPRLWYRLPVVLHRRGSFQCLSSFTRGHPLATQRRKLCYRPLELSHNLQVTCRAKGLPHNLLCHHLTWRGNSLQSTYLGKKGGTMGHVLLLVLPCFIGLLGLCNIWLFTGMIKG